VRARAVTLGCIEGPRIKVSDPWEDVESATSLPRKGHIDVGEGTTEEKKGPEKKALRRGGTGEETRRCFGSARPQGGARRQTDAGEPKTYMGGKNSRLAKSDELKTARKTERSWRHTLGDLGRPKFTAAEEKPGKEEVRRGRRGGDPGIGIESKRKQYDRTSVKRTTWPDHQGLSEPGIKKDQQLRPLCQSGTYLWEQGGAATSKLRT